MELELKDEFMALWKRYFGEAELPLTFFYTHEEGHAEKVEAGALARCVIAALAEVRRGASLTLQAESVGCPGGKRYLGFSQEIMPNFEYFLSCGIPGKLEGERYKKSPELVTEAMRQAPPFSAPARYIVFKRWDMLEVSDTPEVVIFFTPPDVLAGLFTLANYDEAELNGVFTPFGSGCSTIVSYPYLESKAQCPRAVVGMFDISARPFVPGDVVSFSVPMSKFTRMIHNMEGSFLITNSWKKVQKRMGSAGCQDE
jgi:uncharacterized protein (DUF169 family)